MAFKKVGDSGELWKPNCVGAEFIGIFLGTRVVHSEKARNKEKTLTAHLFDCSGSLYTVLGSGKLNWCLAQVKEGSLCKLTYLGKKEVKGVEINDWTVEIDQ